MQSANDLYNNSTITDDNSGSPEANTTLQEYAFLKDELPCPMMMTMTALFIMIYII